MNKQDLVSVVAEAGDLPKAKAGDVLDAVFEAIQEALKKQLEVRLVGFGTFSTSTCIGTSSTAGASGTTAKAVCHVSQTRIVHEVAHHIRV